MKSLGGKCGLKECFLCHPSASVLCTQCTQHSPQHGQCTFCGDYGALHGAQKSKDGHDEVK